MFIEWARLRAGSKKWGKWAGGRAAGPGGCRDQEAFGTCSNGGAARVDLAHDRRLLGEGTQSGR